MHAVSTNQIADILHFNDDGNYLIKCQSEMHIIMAFICCYLERELQTLEISCE